MRPSLQRWLRQGIYIAKCKSIEEFVTYITNNTISYGHGTLEPKVLDESTENYCLALYSPEIIKAINESIEVAFDIGVDATFSIIPKALFPKRSRRKQFLTIMADYRTKVYFRRNMISLFLF